MRTTTAGIGVIVSGILLLAAPGAQAIDKCKVSVDKSTGVLLVTASGVSGALRWGEANGVETSPLFNATTCITGDKAKKCQIADPATLAAKTPPPGCTLYLDDDGAACSAWIRGCTPGARDTTVTPAPGGLVLVDAAGSVVGSIIDDEYVAVYRQIGNLTVKIPVQTDGANFESNSISLFYADADCAGTPLLWDTGAMYRDSTIAGDSLYYASTAGVYMAYQSMLESFVGWNSQVDCDAWQLGSTWIPTPPTGCCFNGSGFGYIAPSLSVDSATIGIPPFHFEVH